MLTSGSLVNATRLRANWSRGSASPSTLDFQLSCISTRNKRTGSSHRYFCYHVFIISPWNCLNGFIKKSFEGCLHWEKLCVCFHLVTLNCRTDKVLAEIILQN